MPVVPAVSPSRAASGVRPGHGHVRVGAIGGRSRVLRLQAGSPLRLLTPGNHGHAAWVFTSTFGGGLVDGDAIALDVEVDAGAAAFLSTQASSKVYRSPRGTSSRLGVHIGSGARFVHLPDVLTCFAGARYRQAQRFDVGEGGGLVALDWLSSGRRASGERWDFDEYRSRIDVYADGAHVLHDSLLLRPDEGLLRDRMGRFEVLATLVVVGVPFEAECREVLTRIEAMPVERTPPLLMSASPLGEAGCLVRLAGGSVEAVGRLVRDLLAFVPGGLGDDPWARKW